MYILVKLNPNQGINLGPDFILTANVGTLIPTITTLTELLAGITVFADDTATQIFVTSQGICINTLTLDISSAFDFPVNYSCAFGNIVVDGGTATGGILPYFFGSTYFLSESAALANTIWTEANNIGYGVGVTDNTFWVVGKDGFGTLKAKSITTGCNTTTTTAAPIIPFSGTVNFGNSGANVCSGSPVFGTVSVTGNGATFCSSTQLTSVDFSFASIGTSYISFGAQYYSVLTNGTNIATVTSSCADCTPTTTTTTTTP